MEADNFEPLSSLKTAVLFLVYNRPDTTAQVFAAIRKTKPQRLYVAADGPRNLEGEAEKVAKVKEIATKVDWPCKVETLFQEKNHGCKYGPKTGISWFFQHEEQGIILEDDCVPHQDFFNYCEILLNRYVDDERVWVITGDNFQDDIQRGDGSYYFSCYNHVWGWATWRRAWQKADMDITFWPEWKKNKRWKDFWIDPAARRYWTKIFDRVYKKQLESAWDYPWTASVWYNGGLTVTPNVNLVSNIGFGPDSTHTTSADSPLEGMKTEALGIIRHPSVVTQDIAADRYVFDHAYGGRWHRFPRSLFRVPRRAATFAYRLLKRSLNL
jgi:hypothetical protein